MALDWQTSKLACVWHCSVGTFCTDPGTLLSLASEERKDLGPKFVGFTSTRYGCLLHLRKAVATPRPDHWYYLANPSSFVSHRQLACLELMSNVSLLQAGYEYRGTDGHHKSLIVTLSTSLFSLSIVLVKNWFRQGLCLWAAWSPTWESLRLMVLFSLFHLGLQSWGKLSRKISAELFSIRKCSSQKMKILQEILLILRRFPLQAENASLVCSTSKSLA